MCNKTSTATPGFGSLFAICPYKGIIGLLSKLVPKFGHIPTQNWPEDALVRLFLLRSARNDLQLHVV